MMSNMRPDVSNGDTRAPSRLQIGLLVRSGNNGGTGARVAHRWTEIRELALLAEDIGVDTLGVPDHLLFRHAPPTVVLPPDETRGVWECFTLLSALAAITKRVTLLPMVACTSFRNPALLAKMADSLDQRVSRFEEALRIIGPMLRGESVTFAGRFYAVEDCMLSPRGPRPDGPPIWIGARRPRMLSLVARYADAYHTDMLLDLDGTRAAEDLFSVADEACRAIGRDPASLRRTSGCSLGLHGFKDVPGGPPAVILHGSNAAHTLEVGTPQRVAQS
jgi:alkanesulfonate monooxygenase SsuD/methylene tetrahydromethanopterin reductase-like flavin-dependent oxidoreductase (luciferase family)